MRRTRTMLAVVAVAVAWGGSALAATPIGPFHAEHTWPLSGTTTPDDFASPFGPRLLASEDYRYDFHRGMDLPAPYGSPVYAVTDGVVRIAGVSSAYSDPLVQIRHYRPGHTTCGSVGCYYSNYMHLSDWVVSPGEHVVAGQLIGYTGASASGFEHLHFEIRDGGLYQMYCIDPLAVLPYDDQGAPPPPDVSVDARNPRHPLVTVAVTLPPDELDLDAVTVRVYRSRTGRLVSEQTYDLTEWNRLYTPKNDPYAYLDDPDFNGVYVDPDQFHAWSDAYRVRFTFEDLSGSHRASDLLVEVDVRDVLGQVTTEDLDGAAGF